MVNPVPRDQSIQLNPDRLTKSSQTPQPNGSSATLGKNDTKLDADNQINIEDASRFLSMEHARNRTDEPRIKDSETARHFASQIRSQMAEQPRTLLKAQSNSSSSMLLSLLDRSS